MATLPDTDLAEQPGLSLDAPVQALEAGTYEAHKHGGAA